MYVTIAIPDDLAARLGSAAELERQALEALAREGFRSARMGRSEVQTLLGLADEAELDGFLKGSLVGNSASIDDRADAEALVGRFRAFAAQNTLDGVLKDLITEGRS